MENVEKMEIRLKECCLTCNDFEASGAIGFLASATNRYIGCSHMNVCYKYLGMKRDDE